MQSVIAQSGWSTDSDLEEFTFLNANQDSAAATRLNRREMLRRNVEMNYYDLDSVVSEDAGLLTLSLTFPPIGDCVYVGFRHMQRRMAAWGWPTGSDQNGLIFATREGSGQWRLFMGANQDATMNHELPDRVAPPKRSWVASLKQSCAASLKRLTSSAGANNTVKPAPPPPRTNVNKNSAGAATMNRRLSSPKVPPTPSSIASKLPMFGSPEFAAPPKSNAIPGISEAASLTLDETRDSGTHVIPPSPPDVRGRSIDSLRGDEAAEFGSKLNSVRP